MPASFRPANGTSTGPNGQSYTRASSNSAYSRASQAVQAAEVALEAAHNRLSKCEAKCDKVFAQCNAASFRLSDLHKGPLATDAELDAAHRDLLAASEACTVAGDEFKAAHEAFLKAQEELKRAERVLKYGGVDPGDASAKEGVPPQLKFSDQWRSYGTKPKPTYRDYQSSSKGYGSGSPFPWGSGPSYEKDYPQSGPRASSSYARPGAQQAYNPSASSFIPTEPQITGAQCAQWLACCKLAFADKSSMTAFPAPPVRTCYRAGCKANASNRALEACGCNLKDTLRRLSAVELKAARIMFHPDKFGLCPEAVRGKIQKAASEVFVVAEALFAQARK